jgi:hypothetical protein
MLTFSFLSDKIDQNTNFAKMPTADFDIGITVNYFKRGNIFPHILDLKEANDCGILQ